MQKSEVLCSNILFEDLLQSARVLPHTSYEVGSINLSLKELKLRSKSLAEKLGAGSTPDTRAHYFFASCGVNAENIERELNAIDLRPVFDLIAASKLENDLDKYLQYKKDENIIASIEESIRKSAIDFDAFIAQNVSVDWDSQLDQICLHFGLVPVNRNKAKQQQNSSLNLPLNSSSKPPFTPSHSSSFATPRKQISPLTVKKNNFSNLKVRAWGQESLGKSILGPSIGNSAFADSLPFLLNSQQQQLSSSNRRLKYALVIENLNNARLLNKSFPLFEQFEKSSTTLGSDSKSTQLRDAWNILMTILSLGLLSSSNSIIPGKGRSSGMIIPSAARLQGRFHNAYSTFSESIESVNLRSQLVNGSMRYLENQFFQLIESEISKYPNEAQLGGIPSIYNKIKAYTNLLFFKNGQPIKNNLEIVNGLPIWALLFYFIRSGHLKEAVDFTRQQDDVFQKIERSFPVYLRAFALSPDRRLPKDLFERIKTEFIQRIRFYDPVTSDPYKYALYKIIGRCDLSRKTMPEVLPTVEDWLWAHLSLTRESGNADLKSSMLSSGMTPVSMSKLNPANNNTTNNKNNTNIQIGAVDEPLHERYTITDFQNVILQFGERHFNPKGNNPALYLHILLLTGQFERAVHYAHKYFPEDAVHFAIALAYYGLLRVTPASEVISSIQSAVGGNVMTSNTTINKNNISNNNNNNNNSGNNITGQITEGMEYVQDNEVRAGIDLLTLSGEDLPQINFAFLIGYYTQLFRQSEPEIAVNYLALIPLGGKDQIGLSHEAVREFVLESGDFATLLGDVQADGTRAPGVLEKKMKLFEISNEEEFLHTITDVAAVRADSEGRIGDAILLYHLSEQYDSVVSLVNKLLSELLSATDLGVGDSDKDGGGTKWLHHIGPGAPMSLTATSDPSQLANNIMRVYNNNMEILSSIQTRNREACEMLMRLVDARTEFEAGHWELSLNAMMNVNVVPLGLGLSVGDIRRKAQQFGNLQETVARNVPLLLRMAMESIVQLRIQLVESSYNDATKNRILSELMARAKNCMIYAGMIQYRMPQSVFSQLTHLENSLI